MEPSRREIRVFVSSTFRDLTNEREFLIKRIFPELRRYARERELEFTEIDLRWGLTEEDATFGRIVHTCLDEIDRCSPFFICIFGDRYGWSPQYTDIQKDPTLLHEYPWLEEAVLEEQSIFEMEVTYALLRRPKVSGQYVYARSNANPDAQDAAKLEALKERIRDAGFRLQEFSTAEELGAYVRRDLLAAIQERWPEAALKLGADPQTLERRMHEAFAAARRKAYIADAENISALNKNVESAHAPLVVTAPSGMGKSALLAYWSKYYKTRHPEALVITHFVGLTGTGGSSKDVLRHLFAEIATHLGDASLVAQSDDNLAKELSGLLARIAKPIIIVIDALNQLSDGGENLDWLPTFLPENVHLLVSTTEGTPLEQLRERGCNVLALRPLKQHEREALLIRYLGEYRKQLSMEQSRRIANDEKTSSPLFLRTLIEELRLSGSHSTLDERIERYLECNTLGELFDYVLSRMEDDYGEHVVRSILTAIWASQRGLAENEVLDLSVSKNGTSVTRAELSAFLIALDYQLIARDGIITLFHDYLRDAVEKRYLASEDATREVHAKLADYFMAERLTKRGAEELIWHLKEAKLDAHLRVLLLDINFILYYADEDRKWDYLRLWRELDDEGYADALEALALKSRGAAILAANELQNVLHIGQLLYDAGKYFHAERIFRPLYDNFDAWRGHLGRDVDSVMSSLLGKLGQTYQALSRLDEAEVFLRKQLQLAETSFGVETMEVSDALSSIGYLLYQKGEFSNAAESLERSAKIHEKTSTGNSRESATLRSSIGACYYKLNKLVEARSQFEEALQVLHEQGLDFSPNASDVLNNLGALSEKCGDHELALSYLQKALVIDLKIRGPLHGETITRMMNIPVIETFLGKFDEAEKHYYQALDALMRGRSDDFDSIAIIHSNLGHLYLNSGMLDLAERNFQKAIELRTAYFSSNSFYVASAHADLALVHVQERKIEEARELFHKYLPAIAETLGNDHPDLLKYQASYNAILNQNVV
jgi:nephrocystin-3